MLNRKNKIRKKVFSNKMYLFLIPAITIFVIFWIVPILELFYFSFTNFNGIKLDFDFIGLKNYMTILENGDFTNSIKNTLIYTVIVVIGTNVLAIIVAQAINSKIKCKAFFRTSVFMPTLISTIVVGFIWSYVFKANDGMIASILKIFGSDGHFSILSDYRFALVGVAIVDIWKGFGTTMIIYLAGLQTIDTSLIEAGKIDGCSAWNLFRKIKLPLLAPTITINVVLCVINGLKAFDYSYIITRGGPGKSTQTLMYTIFKIGFTERSFAKSSALSVLAFLVIIIVTVFLLRTLNKREVES